MMGGGASVHDRQTEVLRALRVRALAAPEVYWRPMDIGGSNRSHHSATLAALVRKGLVERRRRYVGVSGGSWTYRVTTSGIQVLERQPASEPRP